MIPKDYYIRQKEKSFRNGTPLSLGFRSFLFHKRYKHSMFLPLFSILLPKKTIRKTIRKDLFINNLIVEMCKDKINWHQLIHIANFPWWEKGFYCCYCCLLLVYYISNKNWQSFLWILLYLQTYICQFFSFSLWQNIQARDW